jgi:hypothetical protein
LLADPIRSSRGKHGVSRAEVHAAIAAQGGRCAICRQVAELVVDHDHAQAATHGHPTGRGCRRCNRSMICDPCNRGLGAFRDDPDALQAAADYIRRWREAH